MIWDRVVLGQKLEEGRFGVLQQRIHENTLLSAFLQQDDTCGIMCEEPLSKASCVPGCVALRCSRLFNVERNPPNMVDHIGQQLDNYRLLRVIGQEAFAKVYLGEHLSLERLTTQRLFAPLVRDCRAGSKRAT